ncbi:TPX2 (targeting protein for Xklp2) protein family [Raphanus sativus]|nr:TPX2 (targeting protein for Xklp2) protein family [Raphanus sativus]
MAGEIQEPLNLSLLENSINSGSVSFGRFEKEVLSWEKRSSFSHNRYLEEAEKLSKPGSVTQMRAHFEAHFKKKGIQLPTSVEPQTWGQVAQHHQQTASEKEEVLSESMSQCSYYSYELDKCDREKSPFGESCVSCVSYGETLLNSDDDHSSLSVALEKTNIGCIEKSTVTLKPLKNDRKAINCYEKTTKATTKKHVVKGSSSCNTKTSFDTKRGKELKPTRIIKSLASQASISKKTESLTSLATSKLRSKTCIGSSIKERTATIGFSSRSNERVEKRKEENVEAIVRKALNSKARPKSTQARPQYISKDQEKERKDTQEHSSKARCARSLVNGAAKSKLNINKQKVDTQRSLSGIRPNSSNKTAKNIPNRSLAVRRSTVEIAL